MNIVAIAWIYVALMMSVAEATNTNGTVLGGIVTFILYGILPTAIIIYIMDAPRRKRVRLALEREASETAKSQNGHETQAHTPKPSGAPDTKL
jgi:mannose/fructose/N-acetylgalactosamine-specific phosphotransferase system component IID